jgi:hypothetical protein
VHRLAGHVAVLAAAAPIAPSSWPEPGTPVERALLAVAGAEFADPRLTEPVHAHLQRLLGPAGHGAWVALLGFLRMSWQWVLAHPELLHARDEHLQERLQALLAEEPALAPLLDGAASAVPGVADAHAQPAAGLAGAHLAARPEDILDSAPLAIIEIGTDASFALPAPTPGASSGTRPRRWWGSGWRCCCPSASRATTLPCARASSTRRPCA